jgi:hypothetical protein
MRGLFAGLLADTNLLAICTSYNNHEKRVASMAKQSRYNRIANRLAKPKLNWKERGVYHYERNKSEKEDYPNRSGNYAVYRNPWIDLCVVINQCIRTGISS